jgi:glutamyl-tRNA synthetase
MPSSEPIVVGRLAPSPTGAQHLGNARTYLLAWLSARSSGGRVIARIEDIDSPRVKPWAMQQALEDLRWLGLDWDEGPDVGGPCGPYLQTQRTASYRAALERLIAAGHVYPCVCTRSDIAAAASAPHSGDEGLIYPGTCAVWRSGDPLPTEAEYCWRFRVADHQLAIEDGLLGRQTCHPAGELGDFPITRKGGAAAYQLAVVVDDAAMGITEVVRGDDLLPSAFRQLELCGALGYRQPAQFHVPLVVGRDGRRLAKRHGDTRLSHLRERGIRPESIVGWAAHSAGLIDTPEDCRPADLIDVFAWARVRRDSVIVDEAEWLSWGGDG